MRKEGYRKQIQHQRKDGEHQIKRKNLGDTRNISTKKEAKLYYHWLVLAIMVASYVHSGNSECPNL